MGKMGIRERYSTFNTAFYRRSEGAGVSFQGGGAAGGGKGREGERKRERSRKQ